MTGADAVDADVAAMTATAVSYACFVRRVPSKALLTVSYLYCRNPPPPPPPLSYHRRRFRTSAPSVATCLTHRPAAKFDPHAAILVVLVLRSTLWPPAADADDDVDAAGGFDAGDDVDIVADAGDPHALFAVHAWTNVSVVAAAAAVVDAGGGASAEGHCDVAAAAARDATLDAGRHAERAASAIVVVRDLGPAVLLAVVEASALDQDCDSLWTVILSADVCLWWIVDGCCDWGESQRVMHVARCPNVTDGCDDAGDSQPARICCRATSAITWEFSDNDGCCCCCVNGVDDVEPERPMVTCMHANFAGVDGAVVGAVVVVARAVVAVSVAVRDAAATVHETVCCCLCSMAATVAT